MTAVSFMIRDLSTGAHVGAAVLCVEARYLGVLSAGADRIDRRFVPPAAWVSLERETINLASGPLPADSSIVRLLLFGHTSEFTVQMVSAQPLDEPPARVAQALDELLRTLAPIRMSLRQERS